MTRIERFLVQFLNTDCHGLYWRDATCWNSREKAEEELAHLDQCGFRCRLVVLVGETDIGEKYAREEGVAGSGYTRVGDPR